MKTKKTQNFLTKTPKTFEGQMPGVLYKGIYDPLLKSWNITWMGSDFKKSTGFNYSHFKNDRVFWEKRLHPQDKERVITEMIDFSRGVASSMETTYRWLHKDGAYHWFIDYATFLKGPKKHRFLEIIGSWVDISVFTQSEKIIQKYEERYNKIVDSMDELEHLNTILMKRDVEHTLLQTEKVSNASYDIEKNILHIGTTPVKIKRFSKQDYLLKIIFKDADSMQQDWQFSEIAELLDTEADFEWKKLYNVADAIRKNIAISTGIKDFFILTTQSLKINREYLGG